MARRANSSSHLTLTGAPKRADDAKAAVSWGDEVLAILQDAQGPVNFSDIQQVGQGHC